MALFYLLTAAGITINVHYCGGELISVDAFSTTENYCCCGVEATMSCCDNETIHLKLDDEQYVNQSITNFSEISNLLIAAIIINNYSFEAKSNLLNAFAPGESPPVMKSPLWLLNCSLTFYG